MKVEEIMTKNVYTLTKEDTVSKAISVMVEKRFHQIPIIENEYCGMVFLKDLIKSRGEPTKTKLENFIVSTPTLKKNMDIYEAIRSLLRAGVRALPVFEGKNIVGILSETDIILSIKRNELKKIKVREVMNNVITLSENEKLKTVLRTMEKNRISSVPLIDWKEELSGCINLFSIARFLYQKKEKIESFKSAKEKENILNNPAKYFSFFPITTTQDTTLDKIVKMFQNGEEVFVVENKRPIGIIKPRDVLEILAPKEKIPIVISGVENWREVLSYFEKISEKWERFGIQKIVIQIERFGTRERYFGKIKVYTKKGLLIASTHAFDLASLIRDLKSKIEKEMIKKKEMEEEKRKKLKMKGE